MRFGLTNAPVMFQNIMHVALKRYILNGCLGCMKDTIIYGKLRKIHDDYLKNGLYTISMSISTYIKYLSIKYRFKISNLYNNLGLIK